MAIWVLHSYHTGRVRLPGYKSVRWIFLQKVFHKWSYITPGRVLDYVGFSSRAEIGLKMVLCSFAKDTGVCPISLNFWDNFKLRMCYLACGQWVPVSLSLIVFQSPATGYWYCLRALYIRWLDLYRIVFWSFDWVISNAINTFLWISLRVTDES